MREKPENVARGSWKQSMKISVTMKQECSKIKKKFKSQRVKPQRKATIGIYQSDIGGNAMCHLSVT